MAAAPDATPLWWARDEDRTVNSGSYKTLNTTQDTSSAFGTLNNGGGGSEAANYTVKFGVLHSDGTFTTIKDGTSDGSWTAYRAAATGTHQGQQNLSAYVCVTQTLISTDSFWMSFWGYTAGMGWVLFPYTGADLWSTNQLGCIYFNGTLTFSLYTYKTYSSITSTTTIRLYVGTSTYKTKVTGVQLYYAPPPVVYPTYANVEPANLYITKNNETLAFKVKFDAGSGYTMSKARFCCNLTAPWANSTYQALNGSSAQVMWYNISRTINAANNQGGFWIKWTIQANNSANNFNSTTLRYFYYWEIYPTTFRQVLGSAAADGWSSFMFNALSTGGRAGIYIPYLNTSDGYHYIRAYDCINNNWTNYVRLDKAEENTTNTDGGHYRPSGGPLPDGRLLYIYGYCSGKSYRCLFAHVSTYNASTETNMTKIISNWGSIIKIEAPATFFNDGWSYPMVSYFPSNSTIVIGRNGDTTTGLWAYTRWVSNNYAYAYIKDFYNDTSYSTKSWTFTSNSPYLNEFVENSFVATTGLDTNKYIGNFTFRTQNQATVKDMYIESLGSKVYLDIQSGGSNAFGSIYPSVWNGTAWNALGALDCHTSTSWDEWDVTSYFKTIASLSNAKLRIRLYSLASPLTRFYDARLRIKMTGFGAGFMFARNDTDPHGSFGLGITQTSTRNKLICSGVDNYYVDPSSFSRNLLLFYTEDNGYTWATLNGTSLGSCFKVGDSFVYNQSSYAQQISNVPCYNEATGKILFASTMYNYSKPNYGFKNEVLTYSGTLGTAGTFARKNCTWANNETVLFSNSAEQSFGGWYFDTYYNRVATWNTWNKHLCLFIQSPYNETKFQIIYENTSYSVSGGWYGVMGRQIQGSTMFYRMVEAFGKVPAGYVAFGAYTTNATQGILIGCNYTASVTMSVTGLAWWVRCPDGTGNYYCDIGLYSNTYTRLAYATSVQVTQGTFLNWLCAGTFTSSYTVTAGTNYWLVFRTLSPAGSYFNYTYDTGATNQAFWLSGSMTTTLTPVSFKAQKVTVHLLSMNTEALGLGQDPRYPSLISQGHNTTVAGASCLFYSHWQALALDAYVFSWKNGTSTWANDGHVHFGGAPTSGWANVTKKLNTTGGSLIQCYLTVNSTSGQTTTSEIYSFYVGKEVSFVFPVKPQPGTGCVNRGLEMKFTAFIAPAMASVNYVWRELILALAGIASSLGTLTVGKEFALGLSGSAQSLTTVGALGLESVFSLSQSFSFTSGFMNLGKELLGVFTSPISSNSLLGVGKESAHTFISTSSFVSVLNVGVEGGFSFAQTIIANAVLTNLGKELWYSFTQPVNMSSLFSYAKEMWLVEYTFTLPLTTGIQSSLTMLRESAFGLSQSTQLAVVTVEGVEQTFTFSNPLGFVGALASLGKEVIFSITQSVNPSTALDYLGKETIFSFTQSASFNAVFENLGKELWYSLAQSVNVSTLSSFTKEIILIAYDFTFPLIAGIQSSMTMWRESLFGLDQSTQLAIVTAQGVEQTFTFSNPISFIGGLVNRGKEVAYEFSHTPTINTVLEFSRESWVSLLIVLETVLVSTVMSWSFEAGGAVSAGRMFLLVVGLSAGLIFGLCIFIVWRRKKVDR